MATAGESVTNIPWWKEPTRDQWYAFGAAWLGWTLDAFDFTVFLLIMVPISKAFNVPLTAVTIVFTITLLMRLIGATASGWMADRMGRKTPLMISILGYSVCNFIAGFSPTFWFLLLFRALLGLFMGAEWPAGASLAMETWPIRSRGFMSGVLQGSWGLGFLMSAPIYGLFYKYIGWRGMLWVGIAPALALVYIRYYVKEPAVWVENRRLQRAQKREVRVPLLQHLQARHARQYLDRVLVHGGRVRHLLFDQRAVRDPSAARSASEPGVDRDADRVRQHPGVSRQLGLGLGVG